MQPATSIADLREWVETSDGSDEEEWEITLALAREIVALVDSAGEDA